MDRIPFSKKIRKRLIDLGLSQTQLGQRLNISRNRINDAIAGRREGRKYHKAIVDYLRNPNGN